MKRISLIIFFIFGIFFQLFGQTDGLSIAQHKYINFSTYKNFYLEVTNWGNASLQDIERLLNSVITDFYSNLDNNKINILPVFVINSTTRMQPINNPQLIKRDNNTLIYLATGDMYWSQYSYQFSHELCHYIIDIDFPPKIDRFGWLEESICELASLFTLYKMSITWQTNPPYSNWRSYSGLLKKYVDDIITSPEYRIAIPFSVWLNNNLSTLFVDRYMRKENCIIAIHLLPLFTKNPELWKIIHYMNRVVVNNNMTLAQYLLEWKRHIPSNLYSNFDAMASILIGN